jgi:hypothetical protein
MKNNFAIKKKSDAPSPKTVFGCFEKNKLEKSHFCRFFIEIQDILSKKNLNVGLAKNQ